MPNMATETMEVMPQKKFFRFVSSERSCENAHANVRMNEASRGCCFEADVIVFTHVRDRHVNATDASTSVTCSRE
ncbi:hypothetical protein ES702_03116 [subsurface metagenome]